MTIINRYKYLMLNYKTMYKCYVCKTERWDKGLVEEG